ncbi:MAG: TrkH family potassium uptake protein [Bacteroidales bacterium]
MNEIINFRIFLKVLSRNLFIAGGALLLNAGVAIYYSESIWPFIFPAVLVFLTGWGISIFTGNKNNDIKVQRKDAYLTVSLSWITICLAGCLPYIISGAIPGFINAFFESVSGFTTTGSSILTDIEILPKSILFWRSFTHWIGGIGIIMLVIIIMPALQIGGYQLFTLESSMQEKIVPRIKSVGYRLLLIYLLLTGAETLLLVLGGMNIFESICHAFGTVATGGFSPKNSSIGNYSTYIQYIIMIFMLLSGTNFLVHYYLLKRDFKKLKQNQELHFYLLVVFIIGSLITFSLMFKMHKPFELSFREAFFQVISIITCTGFATADYLQWPQFAWIIIFFAMFLGGSTGSTAGGIKMARHLLVIKNINRNLRQMLSRNAVLSIRLNNNQVDEETNHSILSFIGLYFLIFILGTISLKITGVDIKTACGSAATCMAGIGPGIGTVGPDSNFAHLPQVGKIILSFLMLLGRLEIYTIIVLFTRNYWTK